MIRINLLGRPRPRVKRKVVLPASVMLVLFLIPVAGFAGGVLTYRYISLQSDIEALQQKIEAYNRQILTLGQLKKEIEEFERKLATLNTRLSVIEELRRGQQGPVQLLETIGTTANRTETLWLTRMEQRGTKISLDGVAGSVNAVANFMTNLKNSGLFTAIEIKEAVQATDNPGVENYKFSLTCEFVPTKAEPAAPAEGRAQ